METLKRPRMRNLSAIIEINNFIQVTLLQNALLIQEMSNSGPS